MSVEFLTIYAYIAATAVGAIAFHALSRKAFRKASQGRRQEVVVVHALRKAA